MGEKFTRKETYRTSVATAALNHTPKKTNESSTQANSFFADIERSTSRNQFREM